MEAGERGFGRLERTNLTSILVSRLSEAIRNGSLQPGERLPTAEQMTLQFGVSRTVVREAVAALKAEGLVSSRHGVGVFVEATRPRAFRIDTEEVDQLQEILKVMELRMSVEIETAGLAAERRDIAQLQRMSDALDAIDADLAAGDLAVRSDFAFHAAIAAATGNQYFSRFLEFLGPLIIPRQTLTRTHGGADAGYLRRVQLEHKRIFEAIQAGSAVAARNAMRTHLINSRTRYGRLAASYSSAPREGP